MVLEWTCNSTVSGASIEVLRVERDPREVIAAGLKVLSLDMPTRRSNHMNSDSHGCNAQDRIVREVGGAAFSPKLAIAADFIETDSRDTNPCLHLPHPTKQPSRRPGPLSFMVHFLFLRHGK